LQLLRHSYYLNGSHNGAPFVVGGMPNMQVLGPLGFRLSDFIVMHDVSFRLPALNVIGTQMLAGCPVIIIDGLPVGSTDQQV
jgi:hypothetical protein